MSKHLNNYQKPEIKSHSYSFLNQHEKSIQMSTNKPSIGLVVPETPGILRKHTVKPPVKWRNLIFCEENGLKKKTSPYVNAYLHLSQNRKKGTYLLTLPK